jgi:hypothetical protein
MVKKIEDKKESPGSIYPLVIDSPTRELPVKLKDAEIIARSRELAKTVQEMTREELRQKSEKDQMKSRMSELDSKVHSLSEIIASGEEYRAVEMEIRLQENGQVDEVRKDTGEVLASRPVKDTERQMAARFEAAK